MLHLLQKKINPTTSTITQCGDRLRVCESVIDLNIKLMPPRTKINGTGYCCIDLMKPIIMQCTPETLTHSNNLLFQLLPISHFVYIAGGLRNLSLYISQFYFYFFLHFYIFTCGGLNVELNANLAIGSRAIYNLALL